MSKYGDWRVCMRKAWVLGRDPVLSVSLTDSSAQICSQIQGIIKYVGDLSGFGYILFCKETTFTQEVPSIRFAALFA